MYACIFVYVWVSIYLHLFSLWMMLDISSLWSLFISNYLLIHKSRRIQYFFTFLGHIFIGKPSLLFQRDNNSFSFIGNMFRFSQSFDNCPDLLETWMKYRCHTVATFPWENLWRLHRPLVFWRASVRTDTDWTSVFPRSALLRPILDNRYQWWRCCKFPHLKIKFIDECAHVSGSWFQLYWWCELVKTI